MANKKSQPERIVPDISPEGGHIIKAFKTSQCFHLHVTDKNPNIPNADGFWRSRLFEGLDGFDNLVDLRFGHFRKEWQR